MSSASGNSYVRPVAGVETIDGNLGVGADYDSVSLDYGPYLIRLSRDQAETFAQAFVAACWEAGRNAAAMDARDAEDRRTEQADCDG